MTIPVTAPACDVWWAAPSAASPALLALLDEEERRRHARYQQAADRDRYVVAHALARLLCAEEAGCAPEEVGFELRCGHCDRPEPHGKPHPVGPAAGLEISISHSGGRVVVALTRQVPVGVDVEEVRASRDIDGLGDYVLTPTEQAALKALSGRERVSGFFTYWARKEALLKATGEGLAGGLTSVEVSGPDTTAAVLSWNSPAAPADVALEDLEAGEDYRAALALLAPGPVRVRVHDAAALLSAG
nr:4'-phosphopantetheinyl transferase superfamily protein [Marinactinospora thermotolerans]